MDVTCLVISFAWLLAAFVGAVCGIGGYMVAIPIISLVLPIQTTILVCCAAGPFLSLMLCIRYWRHCRWRSLVPILAGVIPGTFVGVWIIKIVSGAMLQTILGLVLMLFLLWQFTGTAVRGKEVWYAGGSTGFISGLLGSSVSVDGPPVGAYGLYVGWNPQEFLGTMGVFYTVRSIFGCAAQAAAGLYTQDIIHYALYVIPAGLLGTILSFPVVDRINIEIFRMLVKIVIFVAAISCLWAGRGVFG